MPGDIFYESYSPPDNDDLKNNSFKCKEIKKYDSNTHKTNDTHIKKSKGYNCFRIGFGRVSDQDIKKGIKIIGKNIKLLNTK